MCVTRHIRLKSTQTECEAENILTSRIAAVFLKHELVALVKIKVRIQFFTLELELVHLKVKISALKAEIGALKAELVYLKSDR